MSHGLLPSSNSVLVIALPGTITKWAKSTMPTVGTRAVKLSAPVPVLAASRQEIPSVRTGHSTFQHGATVGEAHRLA